MPRLGQAKRRHWLAHLNLSPRNFHDHVLPAYTDQLLSKHQLSARLLEIEIIESVILTDGLLVSKAIEHLHRRGMKIYIR